VNQLKLLQKFNYEIVFTFRSTAGDTTGQRGLERVTEIACPDLASYVVYGISMSPYKGIGLPETNPLVNILLPFTISVDFPYSIKVSEVLVQGITINNFMTVDQDIEVIINKDPKYEIDLTSSPDWIGMLMDFWILCRSK